MKWSSVTLLASAAALGAVGTAAADPTMLVNSQSQAQAAKSLDFSQARPIAMPQPSAALPAPDLKRTMESAAKAGPAVGQKSNPTSRDASRIATQIPRSQYQEQAGLDTQAYGTSGLQFSTSRATANAKKAQEWPYRATGRLFFSTPSGTGWCSASLIRAGVVVTAGHCVNDGSGTWYGNFTYVPAYRDGNAPYGVWSNWAVAYTTGDWIGGGGAVPNQRDWAFIVYNPDGAGYKPGDYTGWLGWWTGRTIGRQVTTVGYPGNMYGGEAQMRTDALTYDVGSAGNATWGSDQRGGSSGSPLVMNFRNGYSNTVATPTENDANRVSGVISWGYVSTAPMAQGASSFDSVFSDMLNNLCSWYPSLAC